MHRVPHRLVAAPVNNYKTKLVQQAASLFAKDCVQGYFVFLCGKTWVTVG